MGFEEDLISLDCEGVLGNKRDRRRGDDDWSIWPSGIGILYSRETHSLATAEREWADFIIKIKFAQNTTQQMPRQPRYFIGCRLEKPSYLDSDFYWGSVDGFRLLAMRKEWLGEDFKKYYDQSDGEWFVTECLCAGMELRYAIALRSAIIRYMGLAQLNSSEKIDQAFQEKFRAKWNWDQIRQLTLDIAQGKASLPKIYRESTYYPLNLSVKECGEPRFAWYGISDFSPRISRDFIFRSDKWKKLNIDFAFTVSGFAFKRTPVFFGRRSSGGENDSRYWGTVDGFKLPRMKTRDELDKKYEEYYEKSDGEYFVTECLCANIELSFAVALRSAIIRHMDLAQLDGSERIDSLFEEKFKAKWDWNKIYQLARDIQSGKAPPPDIQLGKWVQQENLPSGLQKYYQNGQYSYHHLLVQEVQAGKAPCPDIQLSSWLQEEKLPSGLQKYYQNGQYNYRFLIPMEQQIQQGLDLITEKKPEEAIEHFEKLLEINPNHSGILYGQTKALILSSESEKIPQQIELLTELKKKLASKHLESNDPYKNFLITLDNEIESKIQLLIEQQIQQTIQQGLQLITENKLEEAVQCFRELLKEQSSHRGVLYGYAEALLAFSETENTPKSAKIKFLTGAQESLEKITKLDDLDVEAFIKLSEVKATLQVLESPDTAPPSLPSSEKTPSTEQKETVLHFRKLLASEPNNIDALYGHASALFDFSDSIPKQQQLILLEKAKEELDKILKLDELNKQAYSLQEKIDEKLEQLNTAVPLNTLLTSTSVSSPKPPILAMSTYNISRESLTFNSQIGSGGFGVVFQGTYQGAKVAIKQLHLNRMSENNFVQFRSETTLMASLRFPNIVTFYGACFEEGHYAMVMEYCPTSLYYKLHSRNPPNNAESLKYSSEIALALNYLHTLEPPLIHRDLKSMNVLISSDNTIKLTDFGLAQLKQATKTTTTKTSESSVGTIPWMPPETFGLKPKYTTKSDIFGLAILLWEIASREIPYKEAEISEIKAAVKQGEREEVPENCSAQITALIVRCWAQKPEDRPSAKEIYQTLETIDHFFKLPPPTPTGNLAGLSYVENPNRSLFNS